MTIICPTVTASAAETYRKQLEIAERLTSRVHIDLMDGKFAPAISVAVDDLWWQSNMVVDVHVMFRRPTDILNKLVMKQLHLVIIHAEAEVDHAQFAAELHRHNIKAGIALLQPTPASAISRYIEAYDHVLVFSSILIMSARIS